MSDAAPNSNFTDSQETKNFVTPFAFKVHESLLGVRLASPGRRFLAICLDFVFIGLLTLLDSLWLSGLILLVTLYSLYQLRGESDKTWAKISLGLISFVAGLVICLQLFIQAVVSEQQLPNAKSEPDNSQQEPVADPEALRYDGDHWISNYTLTISSLKTPKGEVACVESEKCGAPFFTALAGDLAKREYDFDKASEFYIGVRDLLAEHDRLESSMRETDLGQRVYQQSLDDDAKDASVTASASTSIIAWVQGAMGDLGLSFGWAALYFTVLTAWWNGQTLGKRLFSIRVVRIDGKPIDLWESIGRYGGYSAGLGTGLLGFMQIYWDANRQAIQDKISETLVIHPK